MVNETVYPINISHLFKCTNTYNSPSLNSFSGFYCCISSKVKPNKIKGRNPVFNNLIYDQYLMNSTNIPLVTWMIFELKLSIVRKTYTLRIAYDVVHRLYQYEHEKRLYTDYSGEFYYLLQFGILTDILTAYEPF